MQLGSSIRTGTLWIFAGNISTRVFEFVFGIILARLLVPSDFGLLVTTQVFTGVAGFIAGGGMGQALIQAKEITPKDFHVVFTLQLAICCLIYCFFFFTAPLIAVWFENPIYINLLRLSALNFLIRPFNNIPSSKLSREMQFKAISIIGLINFIITSSISVALAWYHFGVWSLVYSGLFGSLFSATCLILYSRCYPRIAFDKRIAKKLGTYGIKFSINDIIEYLRNQTPNFFIGKFLGASAVGLFNKGDSLSAYPVRIIAGSSYQTIFRALSATQENIDQSKYIYLRTVTLVTVYTFPFYIGLFWLAEPFVVTVYGEKWRLASAPLQIFCISRLFGCIGNAGGAVLAARNLLGYEIKIQLIALFMAIAGCWYGIQNNDITLIALGLIPSAIFLYCAVSYLALRAVQAKLLDLLLALIPATLMNASLAGVLGLSDYLLTLLQKENLMVVLRFYDYEVSLRTITLSPEIYLITLSVTGGLFYAVMFLYCPIRSLEKESARWKKILKFSSLLKSSTQKKTMTIKKAHDVENK